MKLYRFSLVAIKSIETMVREWSLDAFVSGSWNNQGCSDYSNDLINITSDYIQQCITAVYKRCVRRPGTLHHWIRTRLKKISVSHWEQWFFWEVLHLPEGGWCSLPSLYYSPRVFFLIGILLDWVHKLCFLLGHQNLYHTIF